MTQQPSGNLISAYLDGELSPREHEQFEKTLATSSELQEELRDYERLRTILRNLPQVTISDEFTSSVLQQAERVSLLPMNHDSNQRDASPASKPASGSSRNAMVVAGSLVATAAALFLMIRLMVMPGQTPSSNSPTAGKSTPQNSIAKLESNSTERNRPRFSSPKASEIPEMLGGGSLGQPERGKALVADKSRESLKFGQSKGRRRAFKTTIAAPFKKPMKEQASTSRSASPPRKKSDFAGALPGGKNRSMMNQRLKYGTVQIGDVIPYLDSHGERMAVFEVTVVDVRRVVGRLEYLLSQNAIPRTPGTMISKSRSEGKVSAAKDGKNTNKKFEVTRKDGLIAIYVESTPMQLTAAMRALVKENETLQVKLKPPVTAERVYLTQTSPRPSSRLFKTSAKLATLADAIAVTRQNRNYAEYGRQGIAASRFGGQPSANSAELKKSASPISRGGAPGRAKAKRTSPSPKDGSSLPAVAQRPKNQITSLVSNSFQLQVQLYGDMRKSNSLTRKAKSIEAGPAGSKAGREKTQKQLDAKPSRNSINAKFREPAPVRAIFIFRKQAAPR